MTINACSISAIRPISRRHIMAGVGLPAVAGWALPARAADYPDGPITLVAPFPTGGAADALALLLAKALRDELGQPVRVENRPGAGTGIGATQVAGARPDGYMLLVSSSSTFVLNPALQPRLPYDPVRGFDAIGLVGSVAMALLVHPSVRATNVQQLVAAAKASPGDYVYGSFGNGTSSHFTGAMFNNATGLKMTHIPYKGSAPLMTDLLSGQIPISFDTVVSALPHVQSGRLRALAVASSRRSALLPAVPTVAESGYPGVDINIWMAVVAPRGLPMAVKSRLEAALAAAMSRPETLEKMTAAGFEPAYTAVADWDAMVRTDINRMRSVAERSQIKFE